MKIGLFFGSFNPVHIGHMALANYFVEYTDLDRLWFIVSPHNPLKSKESLLADHFRFEMVELAIRDDSRFRVSDVEFKMRKPSYTIDTLTYLTEKYPEHHFVLIMGSDGLVTFDKWKNSERIIALYPRYIYPRKTNEEVNLAIHKNIFVAEHAPMIEISSSFIRQAIMEKKNVDFFLPEKVAEYISNYNLYKR
jgi:nicotinate-nucleotide adenylyltransferase